MRTFLFICSLIILSACRHTSTPSPSFVPHTFNVPTSYFSDDLALVKLTQELAEKDYAAVMENKELLRVQFGGEWPADEFTLEQNKADLALHEQMFEARTSFTYSVVTPDTSRVLGCVYINPTDSVGFDAQVHLWVRRSAGANNGDIRLSDATLKATVKSWLAKTWPFENVLFW